MKPTTLPAYFFHGNLKVKFNFSGTSDRKRSHAKEKPQKEGQEDFAGKIITETVAKAIDDYDKEVSLKLDTAYTKIRYSARDKSKDNSKNESVQNSSTIGNFMENTRIKKEKNAFDRRDLNNSQNVSYSPEKIPSKFSRTLTPSRNEEKIHELYSDKLPSARQYAESFSLDNSNKTSPVKSKASLKESIRDITTDNHISRTSAFAMIAKRTLEKQNIRCKSVDNLIKSLLKAESPPKTQSSFDRAIRKAFDGFSVRKLESQKPPLKSPKRSSKVDEELRSIISNRKLLNFLISFQANKQISVDELAGKLAEQTGTELEKALIVYLWVCTNIERDTNTKFTSEANSPNSKIVRNALDEKRADSKGFAHTFGFLCKEMGIMSDIVKGIVKLGTFTNGFEQETAEHFWNVVQVYGDYYLVDCTAGAGYLQDGKFVQSLELGYFLTPPDFFIFNYLPNAPDVQLLNPQVSNEEFKQLVYVGEGFSRCKLGLNFLSSYFHEAEDGLIFELDCPKEVCILATVDFQGKKVPNTALTVRKGNQATIVTLFREPGNYIIEVFVRKADTKKFLTALKYLVNAKVPEVSRAQLFLIPKIYSLFYDIEVSSIEPITNNFKNGDTITIRLEVNNKDIQDVACVQGAKEKWSHFTQKNSHTWELAIRKVSKPLHVAVKLARSKTFQDILSYE